MDLSKIKWDGSYLGSFESNVIIEVSIIDNVYYITLDLPQGRINANYMLYKNHVPIFIDEMKEVFGLVKSGMHTITLPNDKGKKSKLLLINIEKYNGQAPITLSSYESFFSSPAHKIQESSFKKQMEYILVFYYIIGAPYVENRIHIRKCNTIIYPHPYYESSILENRTYTALSNVNKKKWFPKDEVIYPGKILLKLLNVNGDNINSVISKLRSDYEILIKKIDPEYISTYWYIIDTVNSLLYEEFPDEMDGGPNVKSEEDFTRDIFSEYENFIKEKNNKMKSSNKI